METDVEDLITGCDKYKKWNRWIGPTEGACLSPGTLTISGDHLALMVLNLCCILESHEKSLKNMEISGH